jgi:hypothetical protein
VFHCLPDELTARLDALGATKAHKAMIEMLAYYQIQHEDRQRREFERAIQASQARRHR